ncbi:MAG: acyl-CoA dehydrogenase family protein [Kofleriaceae bacterium]
MFQFTQEHEMVRKLVRRWCTSKLEPKVDALENGEQPYDLMRDFVKTFGIADMVRGAFAKAEKRAKEGGGENQPVKVAGMGDPAMSAILAIEISRVCPGFGLAFGAGSGLAGGAIMGRGTMEQKKKYGVPVVTWDKIGAWGMTEPGAGSDAFRSMRTIAKPTKDGYILNGQKTFITNAPYADIFVIYAKIDKGDGRSLEERPIVPFIVERGDAGLTTPPPMRKMGMHGSPTGEVFLENVFVPADRLLGGERPDDDSVGRASGKDVFHTERTGMAPMSVGIIERCLEICLEYSKTRKTWGKPICEYQLVQDKLVKMFVLLQNCQNLMFKQITLTMEGKSMTAAEASAAKLYCGRAATEAALEAIQLLGGNGYMAEYRVEMLMRDAKLLQIGGGTDEIQIINIARNLLGDVEA